MTKARASSTERPHELLVDPAAPDMDALLEHWVTGGLVERSAFTGAPQVLTPAPTPVATERGYVEGAWFDVAAVERVLKFFLLLQQLVGRWRGARFTLLDYQVRYLIAPVFGWKHPDGRRIIRTVWFEIPRKNGKSTLCSGIALYLWCSDREPGAQVYAAAGDKPQARIVFDAAREMAGSSTVIRRKARLLRSVLEYPSTGSVFRALSSDGARQHGLNVHGGIVDEVHVHKKRDLVDALETGTGSRDQPLIVFITTADNGEDDFSIYAEKRDYTEQVAAGHVPDTSFHGVVFAAPPDADPFAAETQAIANPGLGVTVSREYIAKEARRAAATPGYLNEYLRLHLNVRTKQATRWLDMATWDAGSQALDVEALAGRRCYAGLDLSSTTDLTALVLWFPPVPGSGSDRHAVLPFFWLPQDNVPDLVRRTGVPFDRWAETPGHLGPMLRLTEGNVVDYAAVRALLTDQLRPLFSVSDVGYDPWNATETALQLEEDGFTMVPVRQGYATLSPTAKELERLVLGRRVHHGRHAVLRWNIDCTAIAQDQAGNIKPVKPDTRRSAKRIDGTIGALNALFCSLRAGTPVTSVYEDRGLEVV